MSGLTDQHLHDRIDQIASKLPEGLGAVEVGAVISLAGVWWTSLNGVRCKVVHGQRSLADAVHRIENDPRVLAALALHRGKQHG